MRFSTILMMVGLACSTFFTAIAGTGNSGHATHNFNKNNGPATGGELMACSGTVTNVTCWGAATGKIAITSSFSGTVSFTIIQTAPSPATYNSGNPFTVTQPGGAYTFINLPAGKYDISVVSGVTTCSVNNQVVKQPPGPITLTHLVTAPTCAATPDGKVKLTATWPAPGTFESAALISTVNFGLTGQPAGSVAGASIPAGVNMAMFTFSNLPAATYSGTARFNNTCTQSTVPGIQVVAPSAVTSTATAYNNVTCFGGSDGYIDITAGGGVPFTAPNWPPNPPNSANSPYIFEYRKVGTIPWLTASTITGGLTRRATGLTAATWEIRVTDANGCKKSSFRVINQPGNMATAGNKENDVTCNGGADGCARWKVTTGGIPPFTISVDLPGTVLNPDFTQSVGQNTYAYFCNLPAGTYTATISDATCSAVGVPSVTIGQPAGMVLSILSQTNVACNGDFSGAITVGVSGGTAPYFYDIDTDFGGYQGSPIFSNLAAGAQIVTVLDNSGCTKTISATITQPGTALSASVVQFSNVDCYGNDNGAIDITPTGGVGPYSYDWYPNGETTQDLTGLEGNQYYEVTVTDQNGCTTVVGQSIYEPDEIYLDISASDISCHGLHDGYVCVTAYYGTWTYTYDWSNDGADNPDNDPTCIFNLYAGTYTVTVTDGNGCVAIASADIIDPDLLEANAFFPVVSCQGGEATFYPTGGTGPFDVWEVNCGSYADLYCCPSNGSPFDDIFTATNLGAGMHCFKIVDNNGCESAIESGNVNPPAPNTLAANTYLVSDISCNGEGDGAIYVHVSSGSGNYSFDDGHGSDQFFYPNNYMVFYNLQAGDYSITVTDNNYGCTFVIPTVPIEEPDALEVSASQYYDCFAGGNSGSIDLYITGGSPGYDVYWYDENGNYLVYSEDLVNLAPGVYTAEIYDQNGCYQTITVTIGPIQIDVDPTDVSCINGASGAIDVTVSGGMGDESFQYYWDDLSPAEGPDDRTGLIAGVYTLTVYDYFYFWSGCAASVTVQIDQPSAIVLTSSTTQPTCNGGNNGSLTVTATGGSPGYQYRKNGGAWQLGNTFSGLTAATYIIDVEDDGGCIQSISVIVGQPAVVSGTVSTNPANCGAANGTLTVVTTSGGTGPYMYSKNGGGTYQLSNQFLALAAGSYTITIKDANNCLGTATGTVVSNSALAFTTTNTNVNCFGGLTGSIIVSATGGTTPYMYRINSGAFQSSATFSGLAAGSYLIEIKDAGSCTNSATIVISQPAAAISASATATNVLCNGASTGSVALTVSGGTPGYSYLWSNSATTQNLSNVVAGTYSVVVTDANNCTKSATATVMQPAAALNASATATTILCFGGNNGAIALAVSGGTSGYTYLWSPGGATTQNLNGLTAGTYSVVVTDANGCIKSASATVNQPASGISTTTSSTAVSCFNGNNGSVTVSATGGTGALTYLWAPGGATTPTVNNLAAGTYSVTVFDANNCQKTASATVSQPASALAATATATNSACGTSNGSVSVSATGGTPAYSYALNGGAPQAGNSFSGLAPGNYTVTVRDANNCSTTASATVASSTALTVSTAQVNVLCNGNSTGSITVTVSGGTAPYQFRANSGPWQPGATFSSLAAGSYFMEIMDNGGCAASTTVTLTQPAAITVSATATNTTCNGTSDGSVTVSASGGVPPLQYRIGSGAYQNSPIFTGLGANTYVLTVRDGNSCTATTSANVITPALITLTTATTNASCNGGSNGSITITAMGGSPAYQYRLGSGAYQNSNVFSNLTAGTYAITVRDVNNCLANANATVGQPAGGPFGVTLDNVLPVTCTGGSNGAINVTVSGCGPFTFVWTKNGATVGTSEDLVNVPAGTYDLKVTDAGSSMISLNGTVVGTNTQTVDNFTLANNTTCYATLTWSAKPNITSYSVQYKLCSSSSWTTVNVGNVTTYDVTGLAASTCYDYAVRFNSTPCNGAWTYLTAQTSATWNPPVNPKAVVNSNSSATISWMQSGCGGPVQANVEVRYRKVGATTWTVVTLSGTALSTTLNGLTPNTCYEYRLRNKYISGGTQWSNMTPSKTFCLPLNVSGGGGGSSLISQSDPAIISVIEGVLDMEFLGDDPRISDGAPLDFTLFPNPATEEVALRLTNVDEAKPLTIRLLSVSGRLILEKTFIQPADIEQESLDVSALAPGLYFIEIKNGEQRRMQKLVKA